MKLNKYYVSVNAHKGEGGIRRSTIYSSIYFTDKKEALKDFAMCQGAGVELEYPYSAYDEVWIHFYKESEGRSVVLFSTMIDINALKADYKIERRYDIID